MEHAVNVLAEIAAKDARQLPRFESSKSGDVFAKLCSTRDLEYFANESYELSTRMPQCVAYAGACNSLTKLYLAAYLQNKVGGRELAGITLYAAVAQARLIDEFVPTLSPDDPSYPIRMQGLEQMNQGLGGMATGAVKCISEDHYSIEDRRQFIATLQDTFPSLLPRLAGPTQLEVETMIDQCVANPALETLEKELRELRAACQFE